MVLTAFQTMVFLDFPKQNHRFLIKKFKKIKKIKKIEKNSTISSNTPPPPSGWLACFSGRLALAG